MLIKHAPANPWQDYDPGIVTGRGRSDGHASQEVRGGFASLYAHRPTTELLRHPSYRAGCLRRTHTRLPATVTRHRRRRESLLRIRRLQLRRPQQLRLAGRVYPVLLGTGRRTQLHQLRRVPPAAARCRQASRRRHGQCRELGTPAGRYHQQHTNRGIHRLVELKRRPRRTRTRRLRPGGSRRRRRGLRGLLPRRAVPLAQVHTRLPVPHRVHPHQG